MASKGEAGADGWFRILGLCRALQEHKKGHAFTAFDLSDFGEFQTTHDTKAAQTASAWLGKFSAWGYLERGEPIHSGKAGRPITTYFLTEEGASCEERPGRLTRLIRAIRAFETARGTREEEKIYKALLAECGLVEKNRAKEK